MGVNRHEDLVVWQLADRLFAAILELAELPSVRRDSKLCDQIRASGRSISANIAEGFRRYSLGDFIRFLRYAHGSLAETQTYVREVQHRGLASPDQIAKLNELAARTGAALTALLRSLRRIDQRK